jgi:hypothetical protein|tara:strand:- start:150 stop:950 length:801 start_codon:yes stop_codon:yes gene_type:complete
MELLFNDKSSILIKTRDCLAWSEVHKIYRHLQHIDIPFKAWDYPSYTSQHSFKSLVDKLAHFGKLLDIDIDISRCLRLDQTYYNLIHKIYEDNYNGNPTWLDFHEHIHICEQKNPKISSIYRQDWREQAGPLIKKINKDLYTDLTTKINAGDVFTQWAELGKPPCQYWKDNEPNNIKRICELAKPWDNFNPVLCVAMQDIDLLDNIDDNGFNEWWKLYENDWCRHWGIKKWSIEDMHGVLVYGTVDNIALLNYNLMNNISPVRISL